MTNNAKKCFFSKSFLFLLLATVYFYPCEIEATLAEPNVGSPNSFLSSEEEEANDLNASQEEYENLQNLLRKVFGKFEESTNNRATDDQLSEDERDFLSSDDYVETEFFDDCSRNDEERKLQTLKEKRITWPKRFADLAREYYESWKKFEKPIKDVRDIFDDKRHEDNKEVITVVGRITPVDDEMTKNIINAPVAECPEGKRKDQNGKCRTIIW